MKKNIGILFDLDGTLLDTESLIYRAFHYVFTKYRPDYVLEQEEFFTFLGPSLFVTLERYFPADQVETIFKDYRDFSIRHQKEEIKLYPDVLETLQMAKQKGYPLAVVTTKAKETAVLGLQQFDLLPYFETVLTLEDVTKVKPDPEGVIKAMKILQVDRAIMIGDNVSDIEAGKNAGIYTGAVKWATKGYAAMQALQPDILLDTMSDVIHFVDTLGG